MTLSAAQAQHSAQLVQKIREEIRAQGGWLSFERFMEQVLYAPGLGYYSAGSVKLGPAGDFTTAPEVSDLFSRCVARQCQDILATTGGDIFELGAGTGRMAATILDTLETLKSLPGRYLILEVSPDLRERQARRIAQLPEALRRRVQWLDRLPDTPLQGVLLANEVLDALPTRRIHLKEGVLHEGGVALDAEALIEQDRPADPALCALWESVLNGLPALPATYQTELCTRAAPWIASLADHLAQGALLLFDYGLPRAQLYHPQRIRGTLQCHFRHQAHDQPLAYPGLQDLTAWVDFTGVAEAALASGLEVAGFSTQAAFLLATGIEQDVAAADDLTTQVRLAGEARRLLLPGEMGEAFKVMALTRGLPQSLTGFTLQDLRASL